jgi:beta-barrel assembly-enhancing protease
MSAPSIGRSAASAAICAVFLVLSSCSSIQSLIGNIGGAAVGAALGDTESQQKLDTGKGALEEVKKAQEDFTPEQEYYIGRAVAATILGDQRYPAYKDAKSREYVNLLGLSLAYGSSMPETYGGWHFLVLDSAEINAFGAPAGYVMISRELLRCAKAEDEVAAILAHEIGHVALRHGINAIKSARTAGALTSGGKALLILGGNSTVQQLTAAFGDVIKDVLDNLVNKGYSRQLEYQADAAAVAVLAGAGYDPRALVRMLEVMQTKWKKDGPGFMKTHPSPAERIKELEKVLAGVPAPAAPTAAAAKVRQDRYQAALGKI